MGSSATKAKDSTLQSSRTDILKSDSRIESPKELKRNKIKKNYTHVQHTLTTSHSSNYILIVLFESLIIFLIEIKIKLKTEFDFFVFLILSTVPRTLQSLNTYIIHSSATY